MITCWLLIGYLKANCWLLNIVTNITDNIASISISIPYKYNIQANLQDHVDYKKAFP
jgi:hypothetical protein